MGIGYYGSACLRFSLLSLVSSLLSLSTATGAEYALDDAIRRQIVAAQFVGSGGSSGDVIYLRIRKSASAMPGEIVLTVLPGTMLISSNNKVQNMVIASVRGRMTDSESYVPENRIRLKDSTEVVYLLEAYCADFEKDNPEKGGTFMISPPNVLLTCVANVSKKLGVLSIETIQAAVWIAKEGRTFEQVSARFPVDQDQWRNANQIAQRCGK